jgi:hypothetical protein
VRGSGIVRLLDGVRRSARAQKGLDALAVPSAHVRVLGRDEQCWPAVSGAVVDERRGGLPMEPV